MDSDGYNAEIASLKAKGYCPDVIQAYGEIGSARDAAIFVK